MNAVVRSLPLLILSIAGLVSVQNTRAQSVATNPVGYNMFSLPAGDSILVNTFVQATAFQGTASAVTNASNSVITLSSTSGSAGTITSGTFNETGAEPSYYVEILSSGSAQGLIVDVLSNTATTITVDANLVAFGVTATTSFCVRPHTTLSSLFPVATSGLGAYADYVVLYFPNNANPTIFNYTGTGDGWVNANEGGTDAGSQIIYPGQGFILYVQNAKTVPVVGYVKPGPTQVPLYAGSINLVGTLNPVLSGTQTLSNYAFPACLAPYADYVVPYSSNGLLQAAGLYQSSGTNMISASGNADTVPVSAPNSVYVYVYQNKNWVMPSFYTSGN